MKDKSVLITGRSLGNGAGIVERLSVDGYKIIIMDIVEPENEFQSNYFKVDITDIIIAGKIIPLTTCLQSL